MITKDIFSQTLITIQTKNWAYFKHLVEVWVSIDGESYASLSPAGNPTKPHHQLPIAIFNYTLKLDGIFITEEGTFCKQQEQSQLCIEQCVGRQAERDQNDAVGGCTNHPHCWEEHCLGGRN